MYRDGKKVKLNAWEYEVFQMYTLLGSGITPDKLNDEGVVYKEDVVDIMAIKMLEAEGEYNRAQKEKAKAKLQRMRRR